MSRHQEKHPNTKNNKKSQPAPDRSGRRTVDKNNARNVDIKKNTAEKTQADLVLIQLRNRP